ncbi:hypothetical protein DT075_22955 [Bacillus licheniformis]|nr:hypothetical protein DT075_22955 [Bacillus licheniformis]
MTDKGVEERGVIFVEPGTEVYEGMIVGEHNRENDLVVNINKMKQQTNVRSATKDQTVSMKKPRIMSLEEEVRLIFNVPSRGLIGYSTEFLSLTRGFGILNHTFDSYQPVEPGQVGGRRQGVLVSMDTGKASAYGIVENMRREGFELQVSKPEVIIKEIDGVRCEPVERVQIDVPEEHTGSVMESMGARKGEMIDMINNGNG